MKKFYTLVLVGGLLSASAFATRSSNGLSCVGTEPFWSSQISGDRMSFESPDATSVTYRLSPVQNAAGMSEDFLRFYEVRGVINRVTGGFVMVKRASCNDSMSDALYPFEAVMKLDGQLLYGCCYSDVEPPVIVEETIN